MSPLSSIDGLFLRETGGELRNDSWASVFSDTIDHTVLAKDTVKEPVAATIVPIIAVPLTTARNSTTAPITRRTSTPSGTMSESGLNDATDGNPQAKG